MCDQLIGAHPSPGNARAFNLSNIGNVYEGLNMMDSALFFLKQAYGMAIEINQENLQSLALRRMGKVYARLGQNDLALQHYYQALQNSFAIGDRVNPSIIQLGIAEIFQSLKNEDSTMFYARIAFSNAQKVKQKLRVLEAVNLLITGFKKTTLKDSVIYYLDMAAALKDSLFGPEKFRQLQLLSLNEQQRQQDLLRQQEQFRNNTRTTALIVILGFFLILGGVLYRNNRRKQKVNLMLQSQRDEIQESYALLKATQNQLIQAEKMASLGELTAGIAHEIQNPLNFVNNFSEINKELLDEIQEDRRKKLEDRDERAEEQILLTLKENQEKILQHGKRADAIVKGMLQHSQKTTGVKEPTDINALAEEYFRLAYHSNKTKEKLQTEIKLITDFDDNLPMVNVIPQDIGRVLLNLYNNAFWALSSLSSEALVKEGIVTLTTKYLGDTIEIRIRDNGPGIPQNIIDKIFQPFFTTKPPGQGTGLGLSLAYDIVKAHQGEIKVETVGGEGLPAEASAQAGACFIIRLPIDDIKSVR